MTVLDLKAAKMVTGTEDGLTVRKFLSSAKPAQLMDLSKLHIKVRRACVNQGHLTATAPC